MKKKGSLKKGMTLIELLIVLSIMTIVITIAYPLYTTNIKSFKKLETKADLQRDGEYILECLTKSAMENEKISEIKNNVGANEIYTSHEVLLGKITFTNFSGINYNFILNNRGILAYSKEKNGTITCSELSEKVSEIKIKPIEASIGEPVKNYEDTKGIAIEILLSSKDVKHSLNTKVYFRNYKK